MKLKASYLILLLTLVFTTAAEAQVDRRVGREQYRPNRGKREKVDFVEQSTEYLAKELTLDDFQKAAIKNIIEDERENITNLSNAQGIMSEERKDRAQIISARIYKKVLPLLSKTQAEKYTKMEEDKKF